MQLTSINTIKELFNKHDFAFTKSLGQNFLVNPAVCPRIAELGGADKGVMALEIGTGVGVLTKELALRCDKVLAIELDEGLKPILDETLSDFDNVKVVFGDVLALDLKALIEENFGKNSEIICCANLPYYITSPVIMRLLEERLPLSAITVMVQKEAGERITALPGKRECGAISAAVRYYSEPKRLFSVSRGSFVPSPNVDSVVINLKPHSENPYDKKYNIKDRGLYFEIIKTAFSQRRKQIINPLSEKYGINKEKLRELMTTAGINPSARAEALSMEDFCALYAAISENI